ncbi:hypothetical protein KNE206_77930 [Kitasatospora sp. NE20-6]
MENHRLPAGADQELAGRNNVVLVVGSDNSSIFPRMVEIPRARRRTARLVPGNGRLGTTWLVGASSNGISAGASGPEALVQGLGERQAGHRCKVDPRSGATENVVFTLPGRVADLTIGRAPRTPLAGEAA